MLYLSGVEARELRIGNWIQPDESDKPCKVNAHTILHLSSMKSLVSGFVNPIPLNEEWLLRFGFENKGGEYTMENIRYNLLKTETYDGLLFCDGQNCLTTILHVHQLQNLWHSLTTEELEIKEKEPV